MNNYTKFELQYLNSVLYLTGHFLCCQAIAYDVKFLFVQLPKTRR